VSSSSRPPVKLVSFDLGNVMVGVHEEIPAAELARLSGKPEDRVFEEVFSPAKKSFFESGKVSWREHAASARTALGLKITDAEFDRIYCTSLIPDKDVLDVVTAVSKVCGITIASNTSEPHWVWAQKTLPFGRQFDPAILSYLVGAMKPEPAFFGALLERSGLEPGQIAFTDDREDNVDGALAVGIRAFQFTSAKQLRSELLAMGIKV
jgi:putative hydrolase of the HAD superfamily